MKRKPNKPLLAVIIGLEVAAAAFAWRDLSHRGDDQVRGKKTVWRVFMLLNPGNALVYWVFGRRRRG